MEQLSEKIIAELLGISKKFLTKFIDKMKWKEFFKETVSFFSDNVNDDLVNEQLKNLFDDSSINELTKIMKNNNGYVFKNVIEAKLRKIVAVFDATDSDKDKFISNFVIALIEYIKVNKPEIYNQYITSEIDTLLKNELTLIEENNHMIDDIRKIVSSPINVLSISEMNNRLINSSPLRIDLSFFETDDTDFRRNFINSIENNFNMNVVSISREEALLTILYEIKKLGRNAIVVYSSEDWMQISKGSIDSNNVLIPFFYCDMIPAIPKCINIFIYDYSYICPKNNKLVLNKRKLSTLKNKLEQVGMNYSEIQSLIEQTHGFFVPLFQRLFSNSQIFNKYNVESDDIETIIAAILISQWQEIEGDKALIEILTNKKYDDFIRIVEKYTKDRNPLFFKYTIYGEVKYIVTSLEDALIQFKDDISKNIWNNYLNSLDIMLFDIDKKYDDLNQDFYKSIIAKPNFSKIIKDGIYKTLLYIMCCMNEDNKHRDLSCFFEKKLNEIDTINGWASIADYITYISEIVPDVYLSRLENELNENFSTGFTKLFTLEADPFFGKNYYVNYIWSLEQLLTQKGYAYRALRILFKLSYIDQKYKMSNSPKDTLNKVFCAWINLSCICNIEKVDLLREYVAENPKNIKYVLDNLPMKNTTIVGSLYIPKYRNTDVDSLITYGDINNVYLGYLNICLEFGSNDHSILIDLINDIYTFNIESIKLFFENLKKSIDLFNDEEKYLVDLKLRNEIHRHRFHKKAEWAIDENVLSYYLEMLSYIKYDNVVYSYKYLFEKEYDFPLLNPVPFESDDYSIVDNKNRELKQKEIQNRITEFVNNNLNVIDLIKVIDSTETDFGYYFSLFTGRDYSIEDLKIIVNNQRVNRIAEGYALQVLRKSKDKFFCLLDDLIKLNYNDDSLVTIIKYYNFDNELLSFISTKIIKKNILNMIWSSRIWISDNCTCLNEIFEQIKIYGNESVYIDCLYDSMNKLELHDIYLYFINVLSFDIGIKYDIRYQLYEILKALKKYVDTDEQYEKMASIELRYWQILEWNQMYFLRYNLVKSPDLYLEILSYIYKDDNGCFHKDHEKYISLVYRLYHKMEFCPGNINGSLNPNIFDEWTIEFKEKLANQNQSFLFGSCMGKLIAFSPDGDDNLPLAICVREFIEKNYSKELAAAFCCAELNKRSVHSNTDGIAEHAIALKYKNIGISFEKKYPKCAKLYNMISDDYESQSQQEKTRAIYEY